MQSIDRKSRSFHAVHRSLWKFRQNFSRGFKNILRCR